MIPQFGNMNALEGARVVVAFMAFVVSVWGLVNARQGEMVLPRASRPHVTFRRRVHMGGFAVIALLLGWQAAFVATLPEPSTGMSTAVLTSNITVLTALVVLFVLATVHVVGWAREGRVLWVPITPDTEERMMLAVELGRELGHMSAAALTGIALTLETALMSPTITVEMRRDMERALDNVHVLAEQIRMIHANIKSLEIEANE